MAATASNQVSRIENGSQPDSQSFLFWESTHNPSHHVTGAGITKAWLPPSVAPLHAAFGLPPVHPEAKFHSFWQAGSAR